MHTITTRLRKLIESNKLFTLRRALPKGVDLLHDLKRYRLGEKVHTLIDVGANVGEFSGDFLDKFPGCKKILAVEPEPQNFAKLISRLPREKATCIQCAIAEQTGTTTLHLGETAGTHSINETGSGKGSIQVEVKTLSQVAADAVAEGPIMIKTDTEGFDAAVLASGRSLLKSGGVILVLAEVGFHDGDIHHTNFAPVWALMKECGFDVFGFYEQTHYWHWHSFGLDFCNALFIHGDAAAKILGERNIHS